MGTVADHEHGGLPADAAISEADGGLSGGREHSRQPLQLQAVLPGAEPGRLGPALIAMHDATRLAERGDRSVERHCPAAGSLLLQRVTRGLERRPPADLVDPGASEPRPPIGIADPQTADRTHGIRIRVQLHRRSRPAGCPRRTRRSRWEPKTCRLELASRSPRPGGWPPPP